MGVHREFFYAYSFYKVFKLVKLLKYFFWWSIGSWTCKKLNWIIEVLFQKDYLD